MVLVIIATYINTIMQATYSYKDSDDTCDNFIVKVPVEGKDKIQIIYVSIQKSSGKIDGFTFMKNEHMGE